MREFYLGMLTVLVALFLTTSFGCAGSGGGGGGGSDDGDDDIAVGDDDDDDTADDDADAEAMCMVTSIGYDDCAGSGKACVSYTYNANGDELTDSWDEGCDGPSMGDECRTNLYNADGTLIGFEDDEGCDGDVDRCSEYLFDGNGNGGPCIWSNGRIVGGWAQRSDGEIAWRVLEDIGAEAERALELAAIRLQALLGESRVRVRFPAPIQKALLA